MDRLVLALIFMIGAIVLVFVLFNEPKSSKEFRDGTRVSSVVREVQQETSTEHSE